MRPRASSVNLRRVATEDGSGREPVGRVGPVGETVRRELVLLRRLRQMSQRALAQQVSALGVRLAPSAVAKIEDGSRRVDVDDLIALAVALNAPVARLLVGDFQRALEDDPTVALTPGLKVDAFRAWGFVTGQAALADPDDPGDRRPASQAREEAFRDALPAHVRRSTVDPWDDLMLQRALSFLRVPVRHAIQAAERGDDEARRSFVEQARRDLAGLSHWLDRLEAGHLDRLSDLDHG